MKKYIIASIIIYIIGTAIVTGLELINPMTASEVFQITLVTALIAGIQEAKQNEEQKTQIKMLEARIEALRNEVRQNNENQKYI